MAEPRSGHDRATRRLWPALALPGTFWLVALFLVPFYAVMAVAFSGNINIFGEPIPAWNPLDWQFATFRQVVSDSVSGPYQAVWIRTATYTVCALLICVVIGYPVAYYTARLAGKRRGLVLALILAPWWINYITRMLAWVNLLQDDGYVNKAIGIFGVAPVSWLAGNPFTVVIALAYGYLPFFIIPLFASLDRIDQRLLEASRDLGVGSVRTFLHVTLPLSKLGLITALVITALPLAGDYYTNTIVSGSPNTTMIGNQIELFLLQGPLKNFGASLVLLLSLVLLFFMAYYLILTQRASKERPMTVTEDPRSAEARPAPARSWVPPWRNPWRRPYVLAAVTWLYILWSLLPVLIAVQFSFNDGRSRSTWQGFSTQWYCCAEGSVGEDPSLLLALQNSLILAAATVLVATPLGVMLAMGLTRWRSRSSKVANGIALVPLVTPELVIGSALYLVMVNLYQFVPLGRPAMLLGHVTFSVSYVLVIVRSRLLAIGGDYEEAGQDLGASPLQAIRTILIPLLMPSIFASAMLVFATSLDDFVVSQFLFGNASNVTVPIKLYNAVRSAPTPALNALATLLLVASFLALILAYVGLRARRRGCAVGARGPRRLRLIATDDGSAVARRARPAPGRPRPGPAATAAAGGR